MYLIDTDILIWVLRGDKKYKELFLSIKNKESLAISVITVAEIYKNIFPSELLKTENLLNEFEVYDVTASVAKQSGLYWQEYRKKLINLSLLDCFIAATANLHDSTLVTLNKKHFPMKDIKLLDII